MECILWMIWDTEQAIFKRIASCPHAAYWRTVFALLLSVPPRSLTALWAFLICPMDPLVHDYARTTRRKSLDFHSFFSFFISCLFLFFLRFLLFTFISSGTTPSLLFLIFKNISAFLGYIFSLRRIWKPACQTLWKHLVTWLGRWRTYRSGQVGPGTFLSTIPVLGGTWFSGEFAPSYLSA